MHHIEIIVTNIFNAKLKQVIFNKILWSTVITWHYIKLHCINWPEPRQDGHALFSDRAVLQGGSTVRGEESQNSQALTVNTLVVAMDIQHLAARETAVHSLIILFRHNRWSHDQVLEYHVRSHDQVLEYHVRSHDQVLEYHVRSHDQLLEYVPCEVTWSSARVPCEVTWSSAGDHMQITWSTYPSTSSKPPSISTWRLSSCEHEPARTSQILNTCTAKWWYFFKSLYTHHLDRDWFWELQKLERERRRTTENNWQCFNVQKSDK